MTEKHLTLVIVYDDQRILLGMKKRGFGEGRWNGFGGKVHEGETIEAAAKRELEEEAGITSDNLMARGVLRFSFVEKPDETLVVHLFSTTQFSGEATESEEMRPLWFLHAAVPYADMWPDDIFWLPLLLEGKNIHGTFHFKDRDTILKKEIQVQ
ncbi:MAG: 8-oxo-dGTP diphosphatase [Patescibacteria group bacterium]|jgi:8-oxo-dGTP diphosphatase/2-hydroxy-dATP diphosphatase